MAPETVANAESESEHTLTGFRESVPVGDKYDRYESDRGTIKRGDIVVFDDPDTFDRKENGERVTSRVFIGFVESICDMDHTDGVELFISAGIGRIEPFDSNVGVRGEDIDTTVQMGVDSQIERFLSRANITGREDDPVSEAEVSELRVEWTGLGVDEAWN